MPGDLPVVERRSADVVAHQFAHALVRVDEVTGDLFAARLAPSRNENGTIGSSPRSAGNREKSMLRRSSRGGVPVFSRPIVNPTVASECRQLLRRRLARAARRPLLVADVHEAVQKRARRDDERAARDPPAVLEREAADAPVLDQHPAGASEHPGDVRLRGERVAHPCAVSMLVRLRARRPHRRAAAAVEQLELNAGRVDRQAHQAAERVDLADEVALRRPADRRIARHQRDGLGRQRARDRRGSRDAPPPTRPRSRHGPRR